MRMKHKIEFQAALFSVIDEVNSRINLITLDFSKVRHGPSPLSRISADQVITPALQRVDAKTRVNACAASELESNDVAIRNQRDSLMSQKDTAGICCREEQNGGIYLADVWFKREVC